MKCSVQDALPFPAHGTSERQRQRVMPCSLGDGDQQLKVPLPQAGMSELSDEASESELLSRSLSMWHGVGQMICREELDVPLDLHTASSVGQYEVVQECIRR